MTVASFILKNALRNKRRAALSILSVAVSLFLFVTLQGLWEKGASFAAAMLAAAVMTSKRWSPGLMWRRWRIARSTSIGCRRPPGRDPAASAR